MIRHPGKDTPIQGQREHDHAMRELIALGEEARQFLSSTLATFIRNAAEQKVVTAQVALGSVNPDDRQAIVALQDEIRRYNHYDSCLRELVTAGESAYQLYLQQLKPE